MHLFIHKTILNAPNLQTTLTLSTFEAILKDPVFKFYIYIEELWTTSLFGVIFNASIPEIFFNASIINVF